MAAVLHFAPRGAPVVPGPVDAALWYAGTLRWPVLPETAGPDGSPTTNRATITGWWDPATGNPQARVALATGPLFDVLDVPGAAGVRALGRAERLGVPTGPVAATTDGRVQFLVAPGIADALPGLLDWLEWSGVGLDLRAHGAGDHVLAPSPWPATWLAPWPRPWEAARWLRPPADAGRPAHVLPRVDVRFPDVTRLLNLLADSCQQIRLLPRPRRTED